MKPLQILTVTLFTSFLLYQNSLHADALEELLQDSSTTLNTESSELSNPLISEEGLSVENSEEFLSVEEAYQLSVSHTENGINLDWVIADAYFLYGEQFRLTAEGKTVKAKLPVGIIQYDPIFEKDVEKHYQFAQVTINKDQLPTDHPFELIVTSQGCADAGLCYPPETLKFTVNEKTISPIIETKTFLVNSNTSIENNDTAAPTHAPLNISKALTMLVFAIIGGMALNLMPCVLPVLSLKALSLANSQESHNAQGWSYTLGVISTFVIIAAALLAVRAAGQSVGWGFQLQSPSFVTVLVYLFFIMGLSLSGYISVGTRWMSLGQNLTQGSGLKQSYFTGVLAAVVASPCTAPFMAPALGFAITQPWPVALCIFAGLGLGMALPLLLLSYLPQLGKWLPQPGAWMETFKQALAFPLYLTAIWLLWVLSRQLGADAAMLIILGAVGIVFIFWLGQRASSAAKISGLMTLVLIILMSWNINQRPAQETVQTASEWEPYDEGRLLSLREQGKAVFINLTADWCITCLANEKLVFTEATLDAMLEKDITLIKGDWTNYDPRITSLLEKYRRGGVPLYLLFPAKANEDAIVLPQILSPSKFKQQIEAI